MSEPVLGPAQTPAPSKRGRKPKETPAQEVAKSEANVQRSMAILKSSVEDAVLSQPPGVMAPKPKPKGKGASNAAQKKDELLHQVYEVHCMAAELCELIDQHWGKELDKLFPPEAEEVEDDE